MRRRHLLLLLLLLACAGAASAQEAVVVAHPGVDAADVDEPTLRRIFLGKKTRWGDGTPVVPVMLEDGPVHEWFVEERVGRSVAKFVTFWKQAVFTGRGMPPRTFATEDELLFYVSRTPGAIGYASRVSPSDGVKVLDVRR
ncbi:hypothetical protein KDK88_01615 [bacterium]|nr:hypothetical protein [bacterium]HPF34247.1 hypothetical protein [Candidatus Krumholzibacteria bacterium]HRX49974.1 hypothetical protein [Candidatus Krumholzibacteria bacterium]